MKIPRDALIRPITFSMIPAFFHCSSLDSTIALISKNWYHTVQEIKMVYRKVRPRIYLFKNRPISVCVLLALNFLKIEKMNTRGMHTMEVDTIVMVLRNSISFMSRNIITRSSLGLFCLTKLVIFNKLIKEAKMNTMMLITLYRIQYLSYGLKGFLTVLYTSFKRMLLVVIDMYSETSLMKILPYRNISKLRKSVQYWVSLTSSFIGTKAHTICLPI